MRTVVFDTESDGFLDQSTRLHLIQFQIIEDDVVDDNVYTFRRNDDEDSIREGLEWLRTADVLVGQNILSHDLPLIEKLYPDWELPETTVIRDTMVLSRMVCADEKERDFRRVEKGTMDGKYIGQHSVAAWGQRFGFPKGDYAEVRAALAREQGITDPDELRLFVWGSWNQDMEDYGVRDVTIGTKLWLHIKAKNWDPIATKLEHRIHHRMFLQERFGFQFNIEAARRLEAEISDTFNQVYSECVEHFGSWMTAEKWEKKAAANPAFGEDDNRKTWAVVTVPKKRMKATCQTTGMVYERNPDHPYCKVVVKEFKPTSRPQIIDRLKYHYDWEPTEFTDKGNPSVDADVLENLAQHWPICKSLGEVFFYQKLLGMLSNGEGAWLKAVKEDGRIHHYVNTGGTGTGRASHLSPNLAQIPKVKVVDVVNKDGSFNKHCVDKDGNLLPDAMKADGTPKKKMILKGRAGRFGFECRSLFTAPPGWWLMGADLSGIELRCLAARLAQFDSGAYVQEVLNGDPHTKNQIAAGLETRDQAKTFLYACVPMDTEALTLEGWKRYEDLRIGELILTYNATTKVKEWQPLLEKVFYDDAEIVEMKTSKGFCVRSTPNHRWFTRRRTGRRDRYYVDEVVTTDAITSEHLIIQNAPLSGHVGRDEALLDLAKYGTDWVKRVLGMSMAQIESFMTGFLLADGHMKPHGNWAWNQLVGELAEAAIVGSYLAFDKGLYISRNDGGKNPMLQCIVGKKGFVTGQRLVKTALPNAPVWCPRTANGSWVMRQGNTITITGNTMYGAGDEKIGSIVLPPTAKASDMKAKGKELKHKLQSGIPAFGALLRKIGRDAKRGYIDGLDGRRIYVKSSHSALNYQLQSDGALIAKLWVIFFYDMMEEEGYVDFEDFGACAWVHDEIQVACRTEEIAKRAGEIACDAARLAGEWFEYQAPVAAESKIGRNWAKTH